MKKEGLRAKCSEHMYSITWKLKKVFQVVSNHTSEYFANSTIHGLVYLGAKDKSLIEKVWWLTVFILSLLTGIYFILQIWTVWADHPVVVSYATIQTSVWDIPFPAVTICPQARIKQTKYNIGQVAAKYKDLPVNESELLSDAIQICDSHFIKPYLEIIRTSTDERIYENILQVTPHLHDTIKQVRWKNKNWKPIDQLFTPLFTEFGVCFTFNSLGLDDMHTAINVNGRAAGHNKKVTGWTIENGYPKNEPMVMYPERTSQEGVISGLQVSLATRSTDRDFDCGFTASGFKIILHNPAEFPRINQYFKLVAVNTHAVLSVRPNKVSSSKGLENIPLQARNCYLSHERQLKYFSEYTQGNCRLECLMNIYINDCKCMPFYLPRELGAEICGMKHRFCVNNAGSKQSKNVIPSTKYICNIFTVNYETFSYDESCPCFPSCTSLDYSSDISYSAIQTFESLYSADALKIKNDSKEEMTRVEIFFGERQFRGIHRSERYTRIDFIAQCGSLLGLCMGFSFLSFVEIVYYLSLRIFCKIRQSQRPANK